MISRRLCLLISAAVAMTALEMGPFALAASKKKPAPTPKPSPTPAPLIEVTGAILEIKLFESLEEAREKMARFKVEKDSTSESGEEEREGGERVIWRLTETEYLWVVAWANKEGKIVKISASVRPEKKKPFVEIGDLGRAKVHNDAMAMWMVRRPDGSHYRVVAKGPGEQATTIYMYSLRAEEQ